MKNAISSTKSTSKYNNTIIIFKGIIFAFVLTLILLFILALILTYTNIQDTIVPVATIIVTAISILIGSSISTIKLKKNGILNGGIIGIVYIFTIYLISSVIEVGFSLNIKSVIMILIGIISGVIGRNCRCKFKQIDILTKKNIYNKMNKKQN